MAQVAPPPAQSLIDEDLSYLADEWTSLPEIAAEWDEWEEHDRLDFVLEWPLREDRLLQLERWDAAGQLTATQRGRYAALREFIQRHRPTRDRLLAE